jgi:hypothetical protein
MLSAFYSQRKVILFKCMGKVIEIYLGTSKIVPYYELQYHHGKIIIFKITVSLWSYFMCKTCTILSDTHLN